MRVTVRVRFRVSHLAASTSLGGVVHVTLGVPPFISMPAGSPPRLLPSFFAATYSRAGSGTAVCAPATGGGTAQPWGRGLRRVE